MNQQREQEALLAAQGEQELRAQKLAAQEKEEPPQNSNFHQVIGEICGTKVCEEQKLNMEDTMLELLEDLLRTFVPIQSESEVTSDNESECDVPVNDESSPIFTTFSNHLFDCNDDFTSSDDKSLSNEDVSMENFKIYSNPLVDDEESISPKIDPHYFNAESDLIKSLLNQDTLIDSSPKFDYLLEEFSGKLAHIDPIPPRIEEDEFDLEEEIRLVENLLYDNSSPRPPEELNAEITDTIVKSLSLHLLSPLRIVTLKWRISTYFLIQMNLSPSFATALSPGYIDECDPSKDPEEDPADYPTDGGDDEKEEQEEESSKDDDDDDEASKEDEEEEEHLALADSAILPVTDPVPLDEEIEPFETDESAPMPPPPRSPQTKDLFSQTRLCRA
nr:hypothetical protein [Tanacetum cinerariifolium]